jgi:hypothetical protein
MIQIISLTRKTVRRDRATSLLWLRSKTSLGS